MLRRSAVAAVLVLLVFGALVAFARAQSESGEIDIVVTDTTTKQPLELARVLLAGPGHDVGAHRQERQGDLHRRPRRHLPRPHRQARLRQPRPRPRSKCSTAASSPSASLWRWRTNGLKVIGHVTAKSSATISSSSIDANSPQRRLSDDLAGALNKLSGVSVSTSSDDSDATQTISLEGHDASQTQLTLDGIPLNAPGSAGNLGNFATDLFGGASVHMGASLGGLGGSVNFSTLQPTLSWQSQLQLSVGSYGRYNYSVAETGSAGKLGMAVQTTSRLYPSLVDGERYLDASGLDYVHDGDSNIYGNLINARYEFGDNNSLSAMFLNSWRNTNVVCLRYNGDPQTTLPCGYGPGNTNTSNVQLYSRQRQRAARRDAVADLALFDRYQQRLQPAGALRQRRAVAQRLLQRYALDRIRRSTPRCRRSSATRSPFKPTARRRSSTRRR